MKILQSSDYRIYFDDVRMDPYIKTWNAGCGLRASDAVANITMYRTEKLEQWKGYLTQVRIFARNVFSGKFGIVFEGEIMNRNWGDQRNDTGEISFFCKGFYHWLDIPIPLMIADEDAYDQVQKFRYEAQNIDVLGVQDLFQSREKLIMKDKSIKELIDALFKTMNSGYYLFEDSTFAFAKLQDRFKVMGEIIKEFREAGYLDAFTFVRTTQIDSFYVYLTQVLVQMMFEFYQDRDGAFRIKNPSWKDSILKAHILDESVVQNASGFNDWENEPSRVLVIGGQQDIARNFPVTGIGNTMQVPMGLFVGLPGKGQYFSRTVELLLENYGEETPSTGGGGEGNFYDDITGKYTVTSKFGPRDGRHHNGTDYNMRVTPLRNLGVSGEVVLAQTGNATAGNWIIIKQTIGGQDYHFVYMHLSELHVKKGDNVTPGQLIGISGNTGDVRGANGGYHLHLEIWKGPRDVNLGGVAIDPEAFLKKMRDEADYGGTDNAPGSTEVVRFMNQDLKNQSNLTAEQLNVWLNKKTHSSSLMRNQGEAFFKAAQESGLDPVYIVAHAAVETGWGTSSIARDKFNFFGIRAYDSDPYNSASKWRNVETGIIEGAKWIRRNYYDRGQNSLYKMRYSKNNDHNYATDKLWPNTIAEVMVGSNVRPGTPVGGSTASTSSNSTYVGSPYASTGGFTVTTRNIRDPFKDYTELTRGRDKEPIPITYNAFGNTTLRALIPMTANTYKDFITKRPNDINVNMLCFIIEERSGWKEKYNFNGRFGLMGITQEYVDNNFEGDITQMFIPEVNIQEGTKLFQNALERFSNKPTFALASLYAGSMVPVTAWINDTGVEDFSKVRAKMPKELVIFVDKVIDKFCGMFGGEYLKGDPHKLLLVNEGDGTPTVPDLADDVEVKDYESSFKPVMSDEERLYKVNLKVSEQLLIRYDAASNTGNPMDADALVERYAKYMMQLHRAESHGVTVNCSTCLPFIRPGFNAWLEPTRRNMVFYITRVNHQGSFQTGAFSTVTGAYVRDPKSYDDIEENIFIGETNASAADFGEVIEKSQMDSLRKELANMHNSSDEIVEDARVIPTLSKLYSSAVGKTQDYTTIWNSEFTAKEIENKIASLYSGAPTVVKTRKADLAIIVKESSEFFTKMLLNTNF